MTKIYFKKEKKMGALTRRETQGFIKPDRRSGDRG